MALNKREQEVQQANLDAEKLLLKQLQACYRKAQSDCVARIQELAGRTDMENIQAIVFQVQYQQAIKKQIDSILDTLQTTQFSSVADYLTTSYENGWMGAFYDLQGQGIPLIIPINQEQVVQAIQNDAKLSKSYYDRLGEDVAYLKKAVKAQVSRGIANGSSWFQVAQELHNKMTNPFGNAFYNAMRIARTEGHRVQQQSQYNAITEAKKAGCDIVKQWDSTLDGRTRSTHARLDGQIREIDEYFEVDGKKALYPGAFGRPEEDIHCRCCCAQRAKWALDEDELKILQERADFFGLDKTEDFNDYKQKFNIAAKSAPTPVTGFFQDLSGTTTKIKGSMSDADYQDFMQIVQSNPEIAHLYEHADEVTKLTRVKGGGVCKWGGEIEYDFPENSYIKAGMSKWHTLTHEYGHFFDRLGYGKTIAGVTFSEIDGLKQILHRSTGNNVFSSCDQFLAALRRDAASILANGTVTGYCTSHRHTSVGVQDAVDGLGFGRIWWGHGDRYYNRFYNHNVKNSYWDYSADVKRYYQSLGLDASSQAKVKKLTRQYETASELWANFSAAVTCGGEELDSMKQFFPESYQTFLDIIGKVV